MIGANVGPYHVIEKLGAGGMGEVYRARDTKLNRDVAIKILPDAFASDADRVARFTREAQTLAALNHPHIAQIYSVEGGTSVPPTPTALVMELVDGEDLARRIARGPIPLEEALVIAKQIADALEAAHEQGIIHRDLKPANIKLRPDGMVKVLDFGLAKALDARSGTAPSSISMSPTLTGTQVGVILGTAAYMSPEQARGKAVDKRADIWAFGCVLYEMLSGRRAFAGEEVADTLAFVLTKEIDWSLLPADTPPHVRRLLRRCIEKDPKRRLQHIGDARVELEESTIRDEALAHDAPSAGGAQRAKPRAGVVLRSYAVSALAGAAISLTLAAATYFAWASLQVAPPPPIVRFEIAQPDGVKFAPSAWFMSMSPDGRHVAFVTGDNATEYRLWIRSLSSTSARRIDGGAQALAPVWSPDSRSIVFKTGLTIYGPLRKVALDGGAPLTLPAQGIPGAWGPDGTILFQGADRRIYRIAESGGDPVPVTTLDPSFNEWGHFPRFFLPDGRRFAFVNQVTEGATGLFIGSIDGAPRVRVIDGGGHAQLVGDLLVYHRDGTVMVQAFDVHTGQVRGQPIPVIEQIGFDRNRAGTAAFSVSANGALAYRITDTAESRGLAWVDLAGKRLPVTTGGPEGLAVDGVSSAVRRPALSPDGRQLALVRQTSAERQDIWIVDLDRGIPNRLTFDEASSSPVWSPDGSRIAYWSGRPNESGVYVRTLQSNADDFIYAASAPATPMAWSPDGTVLLIARSPEGNAEVWALPLADRKPFPLVKTRFSAGFAMFSPDGRWFAYCEGDSGADQVYAQPFPPNGTRVRISATSGAAPQWGADGKQIVFTTMDDQLMMADVSAEGGSLRASLPKPLFRTTATFLHRSVLFDARRNRILVRDVAEVTNRPTIQVVLNWQEELRAHVGGRR